MENAPNETDKKALTIIIQKFNINQRVNTMNLAINVLDKTIFPLF